MTSIQTLLHNAADSLRALPHANPELEAAILLCHLLDKPRSHLYAWPEKQLSGGQAAEFQRLLQRRLNGEPIAHITGIREFWSLALKVTPDTLIPRPETELLVELALAHLKPQPTTLIADLGTGSGAIALALASECPLCTIHASDLSGKALAVARENAARLALGNIRFFQGVWFEALPSDARYDLILSNPPYIRQADPHLLQGDLPFEPATALTAGAEGLDDIRRIIRGAPGRLKSGGRLLVEHGMDQGAEVRGIFRRGGLMAIQTHRDLADHERITEGKLG